MTDKLAALIQGMKARHVEDEWEHGWCQECQRTWPCDAIRAIKVVEDLAKALEGIGSANPDAPEVESWKWLARHFMDSAREALAAAAEEVK